MRKIYTWEGYRRHLETMLGKELVDDFYEKLFSKEKWKVFIWRYKQIVVPIMQRVAPNIDHKAIWEKTKDTFTKELILYVLNANKYRTSKEENSIYKENDIKHLVYDILTAEGIELKLT